MLVSIGAVSLLLHDNMIHCTSPGEPAPHPGHAGLVLDQLSVQPVLLPPGHPHHVPWPQSDPGLISAGRMTTHPTTLGHWEPESTVADHDLILPSSLSLVFLLFQLFSCQCVLITALE